MPGCCLAKQSLFSAQVCISAAGLHWNDYGCFCGSGAKSDTAVDEFDAACKAHDKCYEDEVCEHAPHGILLSYPWTVKRSFAGEEVSKVSIKRPWTVAGFSQIIYCLCDYQRLCKQLPKLIKLQRIYSMLSCLMNVY